MKRATALLILATGLACLDPLYEDGMSSGYFVCCQNGSVGTCACVTGTTCLPSFKACAAGRCSSTPSCRSGTGGGNSATAGGSSAAGGTSAGGAAAGGAAGATAGGAAGATAGGAAGATAGGSATSDAGVGGGLAGGGLAGGGLAGGGLAGGGLAGGGLAGGGLAGGGLAGGGLAGGGLAGGGGVVVEPEYEFCCLSGVVTTCVCAPTGCTSAPFTPCASNRCVPGTTTGVCR